ncbi:putative prolyl 4-hydroxylase 12 [Drosera capensis]
MRSAPTTPEFESCLAAHSLQMMGTSLLVITLLLHGFAAFNHAEISQKELRSKKEDHGSIPYSARFDCVDPSQVVQLSWHPRLFVYKGFISDQESDHLITLARSKDENMNSLVGNGRMSKKFELQFDVADAVISRIEDKISAWTLLPKGNGWPMQILHYSHEQPEQKYEYLGNNSELGNDQPLMASVILYLSNVTQGGEIFFPISELGKSSARSKPDIDLLRPVKGNAVLLFRVHPNATMDKSSSHVRRPVFEGEMWCATKFFYIRSVRGQEHQSVSVDGDCTDEDDSCPQWAAIGECQRNPVFMVGSPDYYGTCRKSCKIGHQLMSRSATEVHEL